MMLTILTGVLVAAAPGLEVYTVDLGRVVSETERGRAIGKELGELQRKRQAEIRTREDALARNRAQMKRERYAEEVDALQKHIAAVERALADKQDELLAPELARLEILMAEGAALASAPTRIVALSDAPLVGAAPACDVTAWLAAAATAQKVTKPPPHHDACRFTHFFYVRFDDVLKGMTEAAKAKSRLDDKKDRYQTELDAWQKQLKKLREAARGGDRKAQKEYVDAARRVEQKFGGLQEKLEQEELAEQGRLYGAIEAALGRLAQATPHAAFVEKLDGAKTTLAPSCEISAWTADYVDGRATAAELKKACPTYGAAPAE